MSTHRRRLDTTMVERGLARSRSEAQALIAAGQVTVAGAPATKTATLVAADQPIVVASPRQWASRGGFKLDGALDELEVTVSGRHALDAGASTGGFTDVLLSRGAERVVAVDVGYGQLDWRVASDARVVVLDRTNVRQLSPEDVPPPPPQLVTADLSFISLTVALPALAAVSDAGADFVLLVKPQFEVGPGQVGKGGVVRDPSAWRGALERVAGTADDVGLGVAGACVSPLRGSAGNVEFFLHLRRDVDNEETSAIGRVVSLASSG